MRIVSFLMNRKRVDARVAVKNYRRSIPLVHVRIDHHGSLDHVLRLQPPDRDRHVVDHAESLAMIGTRVMKSPANIRRKTVGQRPSPCQNGSARRQPHGADQPWRIWYL